MDILMGNGRRNLHLCQNPEHENKSAEQTISLVLCVYFICNFAILRKARCAELVILFSSCIMQVLHETWFIKHSCGSLLSIDSKL